MLSIYTILLVACTQVHGQLVSGSTPSDNLDAGGGQDRC